MTVLLNIIISTFLISFIAFIGALTLFLKEKLLDKILLILVSFSAGSLMGGAFFHLIPEALEGIGLENSLNVFLYVILGFCTFFILENFIKWHHCHAREHPKIMPFSYLILVSDAVHNFIDGLIIAASFATSFSIGVITTLVVAFHEIPQEIGDFGILVYGGIEKVKALFLNFLSATGVIFGGIVGFFISEKIGDSIFFILAFAAGSFIYIASSDLIPEIKTCTALKKSTSYFLVFLFGIALMLLMKTIPLL
ncbi:MAG: ZIP family metal transporter [Patescibacteria group bacterium]|nr:ZIP family metal transporter [Patescibacteria group bacterium]